MMNPGSGKRREAEKLGGVFIDENVMQYAQRESADALLIHMFPIVTNYR